MQSETGSRLTDENRDAILDAHLQYDAVRGVRQIVSRNAEEDARTGTCALLENLDFAAGLKRLADLNLSFDFFHVFVSFLHFMYSFHLCISFISFSTFTCRLVNKEGMKKCNKLINNILNYLKYLYSLELYLILF